MTETFTDDVVFEKTATFEDEATFEDMVKIKQDIVFDVRAWGATGDNSTDDKTSIQNAISAMSSGGILFFPVGDYKVSGKLTIDDDNIVVRGSGFSSRIFLADNTEDHVFEVTAKNVHFYDLMIEGSNITEDDVSAERHSLVYCNDDGLVVQNCYLNEPVTYGVTIYGGSRATIKNNYILGTYTSFEAGHTYHAGVCLANAVKCSVSDNVITRCVQGILVGQFAASATNDDCEGSTSITRDCVIKGNKFYSNANHDIYQTEGSRNIIKANVCKCTVSGAALKIHGEGNIIEGNQIYKPQSAGDGIRLVDANQVIVKNNYINSTTSRGIAVVRENAGDTKDIDICGNMIKSPTNRGILIDSTNFDSIENVKIRNNIVLSAENIGIDCHFVSGKDFIQFDIRGNIVKDSTGIGIRVTYVKESMICNNTFLNSGTSGSKKDGIQLQYCEDLIVTNNNCIDNQATTSQRYPIYLDDNCENCIIEGNYWTGNDYDYPRLPDDKNLGTTVGKSRWYYGGAAPASGNWNTGDIMWNDDPGAGEYIGWVCTSGGTSGTWKGFGEIET